MTQQIKSFMQAKRLARVCAYLTQDPIEIRASIDGWDVNTDIDFHAALFALNLFDAPPSEPPYWWAEEVEYFLNAIDNWNELGIWQDAEKLFYERDPGEVPKYTAHPNSQAVKNISNWLAAQRQDEKRQEQMASDPNYKEDLKHARRAAHLDDLADASDSPEEFQSLVNDWDEFCESKRN